MATRVQQVAHFVICKQDNRYLHIGCTNNDLSRVQQQTNLGKEDVQRPETRWSEQQQRPTIYPGHKWRPLHRYRCSEKLKFGAYTSMIAEAGR